MNEIEQKYKWLKENYGFAMNNYKNIVNTKFTESANNLKD